MYQSIYAAWTVLALRDLGVLKVWLLTVLRLWYPAGILALVIKS